MILDKLEMHLVENVIRWCDEATIGSRNQRRLFNLSSVHGAGHKENKRGARYVMILHVRWVASKQTLSSDYLMHSP